MIVIIVLVVFFDAVFLSKYFGIKKKQKYADKCTAATVATVVDEIEKVTRDRYARHYSYPVFEFTCQDKPVRVKYDFGTLNEGKLQAKYRTGMQVGIRYNPNDPQMIYIPDDEYPGQLAKVYLAFAAIATIVFVIIGVLLF